MGLCTRLIILSFVLGCIGTSLLFYFFGYKDGQKWNAGSVKTECTVRNYTIVKSLRNYACGHINGMTILCLHVVYEGYIDVNYSVNNTYYNNSLIINSYSSEEDAINKLNLSYPINENTTCYYNSDNPDSCRLTLAHTNVYLIFFIIFCTIGVLAAIISCFCRYYLNMRRIDIF